MALDTGRYCSIAERNVINCVGKWWYGVHVFLCIWLKIGVFFCWKFDSYFCTFFFFVSLLSSYFTIWHGLLWYAIAVMFIIRFKS